MRRLIGVASRYFTPVAGVATVVGIAIALFGQRQAIADFSWQTDPWMFAGAVALFAVAPLLQGFCFWLVLRALHLKSAPGAALVIWSRSFLVRYAPSGALAIVIRIREPERLGASSAEVYTATAYEQLIALLSGAIASVLCLALARTRPPLLADLILAAAAVAAVALRPGFLGRAAQARLAKRGLDVPVILRGRHLAAIVCLNSLGWLATGGGCYLLIRSLTTHPIPGFLWLTGVYAFGCLLGFVVPLLPGGLGLREGTIAAFLASTFGAGAATALALALRLANTLGEFLAIGVTELAYRTAAAIPGRRSARRR
jgi:glycosyltransferase 2 family protein